VIKQPEIPLSQLDYLSEREKDQLLLQFNDTFSAYPATSTIIDLWEQQVEETPGHTAIVYEETGITYKELNEIANQFGDYLRERYDIQPDDLLGIKLDRSEWMIIAILGVLKSGGAYVPMDPDYPQERIDYMVSDSACKVLIDEQELQRFRKELEDWSGVEDVYKKSNPEKINKPSDLAYVIYTSGTTGNPKGALIEHRNVVRLMKADKSLFDFGPDDVWTLFHSFCFDFSVWEMYGALLFGGKLIILASQTAKDPNACLEVLHREGVTVLNQTPSSFYNLIKQEQEKTVACLQLRYVIFGGEALSPGRLTEWKARYPATRLINMYGITETTVHVTYKEITEAEIDSNRSNIGRPIPTLSCYVLDPNRKLVPIGVVGELYVGGDGVCRGYLNRNELTQEKFKANPFKKGDRLYRTGDKVKILENGEMEYMGRLDDQIKIRGYRIETAEVESVLQKVEGVEEGVVLVRKGIEDENEMVAYVVSKEKLHIGMLRNALSLQLPGYMIPAHFVQIEQFPLTANGKLNRQALPSPEGLGISTGVEYIAPRNATENRLALIWQEILGREQIGMEDDFFELGGHSLKVTRLASQIYKEFEVKLNFTELFTQTTPAAQAKLIGQVKKTGFSEISPAALQPHYPLSSSQRRLWILSQFEEGNIAYNMPGVYELEGDLNVAALEGAFGDLIERHEILRTVFKEEDEGEVRQFILSPEETGFRITCLDLRKKQETIDHLIAADLIHPFDLASGVLLRAALYRVSEQKWVLTYVMHHIISDGWSMKILIDELLLLYTIRSRGGINPLSPLRIHYKDYAIWQQQQIGNESLAKDKAWWVKQLEGELPVLELLGDRPRPAVKTYDGGSINKTLETTLTDKFKGLLLEEGATLFMGLLAAVNTLLYRYTGQEDIILGSPIAGREHPDLEGQIGFYVNTLPLRARFSGKDTYRQLLAGLKQVTLGAYEHQTYPFDEIVAESGLQRDISRNALFDILIVMQNAGNVESFEPDLESLKVTPREVEEQKTSKFDIA
ncbi:MAG: amino acid adenylation domain-containing protein, partial [Chitinophaga rupis]